MVIWFFFLLLGGYKQGRLAERGSKWWCPYLCLLSVMESSQFGQPSSDRLSFLQFLLLYVFFLSFFFVKKRYIMIVTSHHIIILLFPLSCRLFLDWIRCRQWLLIGRHSLNKERGKFRFAERCNWVHNGRCWPISQPDLDWISIAKLLP